MGSTPPDDPELPSDPRHVRASIRNFRRLVELEPPHRGHRERLARRRQATLTDVQLREIRMNGRVLVKDNTPADFPVAAIVELAAGGAFRTELERGIR